MDAIQHVWMHESVVRGHVGVTERRHTLTATKQKVCSHSSLKKRIHEFTTNITMGWVQPLTEHQPDGSMHMLAPACVGLAFVRKANIRPRSMSLVLPSKRKLSAASMDLPNLAMGSRSIVRNHGLADNCNHIPPMRFLVTLDTCKTNPCQPFHENPGQTRCLLQDLLTGAEGRKP